MEVTGPFLGDWVLWSSLARPHQEKALSHQPLSRSGIARKPADTICAMSGAGPSPVRNLSLSGGWSSAVLHTSWAHGRGQRDGYRLALYHSDSQTLVRNVSLPPNASTFLFDGLLAGSEYALKVSTVAGSIQTSTSIHQWTGRERWVRLPNREGVGGRD